MNFTFNFDNKKIKRPKVRLNKTLPEEYQGKLWHKGSFYDIDEVHREDIIKSLNISEDDKIVLNDIINDIEVLVVNTLKEFDRVNVPFFGSFRFNAGVKKIIDNNKIIKEAQNNGASREDLDILRKELYIKGMEEQKEEQKELNNFIKLKRRFRKQYDEYAQTISKSYADMFIWTLTLLKPIPLDIEYEKTYRRLNNLPMINI